MYFTCIVTYSIGNYGQFQKGFHTHIIEIYY
jgi:hypothetical protein